MQKNKSSSWSEKLTEPFYKSCEAVNSAASSALSPIGKQIGRALAPVPQQIRLSVLAGLLGGLCLTLAMFARKWVVQLMQSDSYDKGLEILKNAGLMEQLDRLIIVAGVIVGAMAVAAIVAHLRSRLALIIQKIAVLAFAAFWILAFVWIRSAIAALLEIYGTDFSEEYNELLVLAFLMWLPAAVAAVVYLISLSLSSVRDFYTSAPVTEPLLGDRIVHNLATYGGDKRYRTSTYWSTFLHSLVLVPFIITLIMRGCDKMEEAYYIPGGDGEPVVQVIKIKKIKPKEKERLVLNMNSPIIFYRPEIDESDVFDQLDEETENQYESTANKLGARKKGGKGGWPAGMKNAKVRFIRLEYGGGGDWNQDMGRKSDYNLLVRLHQMTGFKIADSTEHIPIRQLRKFPADHAPPFVFLTGMGHIGVTGRDIKTLRWYCKEEGGMLFVDNGGGHFDQSFRNLMQRVFPNLPLVDIPNDDILFRQPHLFPNGAPPMWSHAGRRARGIKYNGRWIVFYHPGDLNDAWKDGHSGTSKKAASQAYKMGINVINYSFNQYIDLHFPD